MTTNQTHSVHLYLWCVLSRVGPQAMIRAPLPHLWLTIHQSLRLAVSTRITDVQTPQRLAVEVMVSGKHAPLLPHDSIILRRGPVGRSDDGAVAVAGDVVGAHELTARDAEVGGHGRGRDESLGMIEGAEAGAAVHAPIGHGTISEGKVHLAAVQTGL